MSQPYHPDHLRPVAHATDPDPRTDAFVRLDEPTGQHRPVALADHHADAAALVLTDCAPENTVVQFETAKNLYLYAWFVYRFFPVAEHHALVCLEYSLRHRYGEEIPKSYFPRSADPTLRPLLRYAVDKGDIRNEGFELWHHMAGVRARFRQQIEAVEIMKERGLDQMTIDEESAEVIDDDRDWNYVNALTASLPFLRNNYAHGTSMLHRSVLGTLKTVCECLNQVYNRLPY